MMIAIFCVSALALFLLGLVLGMILIPAKGETKAAGSKTQIPDSVLDQLREEYSNFLSYDGSEQSE